MPRGSGRLPGVDAIRLPGEQRAERRATRTRHGIPIPPALAMLLARLATQLGIEGLPA